MGLWISTHSLTRRLTEIYTRKRNPSEISTHSLTRRLTSERRLRAWQEKISTHSLTRRLTRSPTKHAQAIIFQLTASQGGWPCCALPDPERWCISTHSLTRRLTGISPRLKRNSKHFNSQPHKEADAMGVRKMYAWCVFQLTASQGGWQVFTNTWGCNRTFQLTASQGGWRKMSCAECCYLNISTHSLTRRLT